MNRRVLSRIGSLGLGLAAVWLLAFHAALFWRRIVDATIQQPAVLARWLASAILIIAAFAAHRYASRHWHRRHAGLAFGLLALLLHLGIPAEERLLGPMDSVAVVVQTGFAAAAAVLLTFALKRSMATVERIESALVPSTLGRLHLLASFRPSRAPPAL